jgi:phage I-like protein
MTGFNATIDKATFAAALNIESGAPGRIVLLPAGPVVSGRDGRRWRNDDPGQIIAAFQELGRDLPIDVEHATELKAPNGDPAPAVGWIRTLALENGAIVADVEWTEHGASLVASKAYRYVSPALIFDKATSAIVALTSVGLTNSPNLRLPALNREHKETSMDRVAIAAALGLAGAASDAEFVTAINSLKNRAETPDPQKFVPKADLEAALNRATTAETKLAERERAERETKIASLINTAVTDGKIAPASKDHYLALCREVGGLEKVDQLLASLPKLTGASGLDTKKPGDVPGELTDAQKAICHQLGLDEKTYAATLNA